MDNTKLLIDMNYAENISFEQEVNNMTTDLRRAGSSTSDNIMRASDKNKQGYEPILMSIDIEPSEGLAAS